ncbi:BA14K family protein [Aquamicrobium sp. LC103]|uniref:BA14K family protein n=1 Tax=Aquamicrobium sp. LC103 TaxID=1120658 RepID=UPI00063E9C8D|nr:BA14K family protein [Aquamicrobium sp. LC103]TKT80408.1 BA14K family protein [Aquamicrobium sp. LC103]
MNRIVKNALVSSLVAATVLAAMPANAGERWRHHRHHNNGGELLAAGVLGLATGALIAGAAAPRPVYREPVYPAPYPVYREPVYADRDYYRPAPVYREAPRVYYRASMEPWSPEWYRYCENRYRSFDPSSGTFVGYDGQRHFCAAN